MGVGKALRNVSIARPQDRLQFERQFLIQKFLADTRMYVHDLNEWHKKGRMDLLAQTLRSLMELNVWIDFCNVSEKNWRQLVDDAGRDMRDLTKATIKLYEGRNKEVEERLKREFDEMDKEAQRRGIKDFDHKYMSVRDAAHAVGLRPQSIVIGR
jgi:hypothetical protein